MRVRFTERARRDLAAILEYLDDRSPQGARSVKRTIKRTVELIGQHAEIGRRTGIRETRVLPAGRYPYLVYWSVQSGEAWIVHIRHTSRRPWQGVE